MSKVKQVGGDHYQTGKAEQHWDRIWKLFGPGYFVGCATKYVERYKSKNGKEDLEKAISFIQKLIELEYGVDGPEAILEDRRKRVDRRKPIAEQVPIEGLKVEGTKSDVLRDAFKQMMSENFSQTHMPSGDTVYRCKHCSWMGYTEGNANTHLSWVHGR